MRRSLVWLTLGMLATFTACSYSYPFVIINESHTTVVVTYVKKPQSDQPDARLQPEDLRPPVIALASDARKWKENWGRIPSEEITIDSMTGQIRVTLKPGYAMRVAN